MTKTKDAVQSASRWYGALRVNTSAVRELLHVMGYPTHTQPLNLSRGKVYWNITKSKESDDDDEGDSGVGLVEIPRFNPGNAG